MNTPDNNPGPTGLAVSPLCRQGLIVSTAVLVADQISKWWIVGTVMQPPRIIPLTPFFNLVMGWNRGVSFGLFDSGSAAGTWILSIVAIAITGALLVWLYQADRRRVAIGIGLIVGGAVGNLIDRVRYGAVADFLDFHAGGMHWPAFNVADSGITIGAIVLVADSLFVRDQKS